MKPFFFTLTDSPLTSSAHMISTFLFLFFSPLFLTRELVALIFCFSLKFYKTLSVGEIKLVTDGNNKTIPILVQREKIKKAPNLGESFNT